MSAGASGLPSHNADGVQVSFCLIKPMFCKPYILCRIPVIIYNSVVFIKDEKRNSCVMNWRPVQGVARLLLTVGCYRLQA